MAEQQQQDGGKSSNKEMSVEEEDEMQASVVKRKQAEVSDVKKQHSEVDKKEEIESNVVKDKQAEIFDEVKKDHFEAKTKESLNNSYEENLFTDSNSTENMTSSKEDDKANAEDALSVNKSHGDGNLESQKTDQPDKTPEDNSDMGSPAADPTAGEVPTRNEKPIEAGSPEKRIKNEKSPAKPSQEDKTKNEKSKESNPLKDIIKEKKLLEEPTHGTAKQFDGTPHGDFPEIDETDINVDDRGNLTFWILMCGVILLSVFVHNLASESQIEKPDLSPMQIFLNEMEKVKSHFPNQRAELWKRSKIHLKKHLQMAKPTEPVSLILTSGLKAERTMQCLAQNLASAFSTALNASVLNIDGASKAGQDSNQVKLDIDSMLQRAFEGDKPVAIIHRFEKLPPGSTLIFYRYCDHENAAYKKTFLLFTVLLDDEQEIPEKTNLNVVEEMVDDHLQKKFLSNDHPVSFDKMDIDKYSGLWSRISHLILPVTAEKGIEKKGC